ncbi:MAG: dihydrolipoamide acetyltransferase family protein [Actinomycetota bacterium]|uniref:Dihydrolipoamide acetyltransferase component of pyruvate dehydrogenase complex n=1 Tax=Mycobacterium lentiflavum TaxID=141349 RepID=A0ABY3UTK6_MYCLN|nr:dihydrolipoamide acetyltransferase family protein [Mycobacterium lentiflavum]MEE3066806.1 dihydrolipoamide acetyltransferase family protein [Actinomycetota bacterium]ULP40379.1 2-oxo acid dehydrogenase subunit E2 [Mycobacterium lentiflavum]
MIEFKMPALGADMDEGTLDEWLVKPGDKVTRGQIVAVVDTTKAAVEIECWQEGTVNELLVPVGETVQVGTVLATLLERDETAVKSPRRRRHPTKAAARPATPADTATGVITAPSVLQRRRWVSPAARRLAQTLGVDLDTVTGTGPQGAVTIGDVEHAVAPKEPAQPISKPTSKPTAADRAGQMRRSIAAAMSRAKREIPHYYLAQEILLDSSMSWLTTRNAQRSIDERVLPAALLLKAVGVAAQRFGEFNGFWRDDGFQPGTGVHVGVGISLRGGGLVAPAIHDVPDKKLDELMHDLADLVARARSFSLRSSEMSDPTITVTNLGDQGVDTVFGVIYPPQVAIVGFGRPTQRVAVIDGGIRVVTAVEATLAADHRASDGHRGALFLGAINDLLQQPDLLEK